MTQHALHLRAERGRWALAALGTVAALLIGGCGGSSQSDSLAVTPQAALLGAQTATESAGTSKLSFTMDIAGSASQSLSLKGSGAFDYRKRTGLVHMDVPNPQTGAPITFDEVITDSTIYLKSPLFAGATDKPWLSIDLRGLLGGSLSQLAQSDPSQGLAVLQGAEQVSVVGKEKIRGVSTTHYKASIDPAKAKERLPAAAAAKLETYLAAIGGAQIPVDTWLDGKGRVARFTMTMTLTPPGQAQPVGFTMAMDLYDYGKPVSVTVPPASQVADGSALLGKLGG